MCVSEVGGKRGGGKGVTIDNRAAMEAALLSNKISRQRVSNGAVSGAAPLGFAAAACQHICRSIIPDITIELSVMATHSGDQFFYFLPEVRAKRRTPPIKFVFAFLYTLSAHKSHMVMVLGGGWAVRAVGKERRLLAPWYVCLCGHVKLAEVQKETTYSPVLLSPRFSLDGVFLSTAVNFYHPAGGLAATCTIICAFLWDGSYLLQQRAPVWVQ